MAAALRSLGVSIEPAGPAELQVSPAPLTGPATVDCGLAGTVMRFVPPLAATATGTITFDGDPAARRRPMDVILSALRRLGVDIEGSSLPFAVHGTGSVPGGTVEIDASASSQFVSGLLLAAASFDGPLTVRHVGKPVPSQPHIEMTVAALRHVGVAVDDDLPDQWTVVPGTGRPVDGADRAGPVERHPVPGRRRPHRRPGDRPALAGGHHPGRRRHPRHPARHGRVGRPRRRRADRHRPDQALPGSTSICTTSVS